MQVFRSADILIPKTDMQAWSVVACDQFTSEPEYWEKVYETVGDKPSALRLILPEAVRKSVALNSSDRLWEHWHQVLLGLCPRFCRFRNLHLASLDSKFRKGEVFGRCEIGHVHFKMLPQEIFLRRKYVS